MTLLDFSKEFAKHLRSGDHLKMDEDGHYVKYDRIQINISTGAVTFMQGSNPLASMQIAGVTDALASNNELTLILTELDGRLRVKVE